MVTFWHIIVAYASECYCMPQIYRTGVSEPLNLFILLTNCLDDPFIVNYTCKRANQTLFPLAWT
jgi:hypothetical protein